MYATKIRMKMTRFQIFWIQMRKNKPLDETRKSGQTSWTKLAFYSLVNLLTICSREISNPNSSEL
ncbi:hypothetical protein Hanom_Chr04g00383281 [Helianthus anomalus]